MGVSVRMTRSVLTGLFALLLIASLALGAVSAPSASSATGTVVGQTGFAYLGGLRKFAAAVLWNRLEPVFHAYYAGVPLAEQTYMMPTLYAVIRLDPQFQQAYYVASWIAYTRVSKDEGLAIARDGLAANPRSGLMHSNLLQLLFLQDASKNAPEIGRLIDAVTGGSLQWMDAEERFEGLATARDALRAMGQTERAQRIEAELARMREAGIGLGDHDHDGDGKQDH